jgi:ATP-binding cassette subfamily B protein
MGLYTEFEGEILINGISINEIDKVSYYRCLGVVFQDFVRYEFPVDESLLLGNERENVDVGKILQKAKDEGLLGFISKLPNSRKTQLGSNFSSGVQLSGGQWQQITLSRVLNRESDLYIMDEPTSSFDI